MQLAVWYTQYIKRPAASYTCGRWWVECLPSLNSVYLKWYLVTWHALIVIKCDTLPCSNIYNYVTEFLVTSVSYKRQNILKKSKLIFLICKSIYNTNTLIAKGMLNLGIELIQYVYNMLVSIILIYCEIHPKISTRELQFNKVISLWW